jgi:hypothetical protein
VIGPGSAGRDSLRSAIGSAKNAIWNFSQAQEANIIAGLTYVNIHSSAFPGGEIRGQIVRVPSCGDGILDGGESCDDGQGPERRLVGDAAMNGNATREKDPAAHQKKGMDVSWLTKPW